MIRSIVWKDHQELSKEELRKFGGLGKRKVCNFGRFHRLQGKFNRFSFNNFVQAIHITGYKIDRHLIDWDSSSFH